MNLKKYKYQASETYLDFEFVSDGPNGKIRKIVLYQIGISSNWNEIDPLLYVYGYEQDKGWQPFRKNVNYQAFLVKHK